MAMFGLAKLYRDAGDLQKAEERAAKGVEASQKVGEDLRIARSGWRSWQDFGLTEASSTNQISFMSRRKTLSTDYWYRWRALVPEHR